MEQGICGRPEDGETTAIQSWKEFWEEKNISYLKEILQRQNPVIVYGRNKNDYKKYRKQQENIIKKEKIL
ncbi:hypothetical protein EJ377_00440 [Chryseobacterium arthrosphaerae]|uniref:Uncharacterized protein n=1 Tax=Chryseobacterium arthrosphaerae TaxID=651561 RepID=A0A432DYE6_9FLAO|nr:hypothetical protein EJ377_00440 [Chryseobacterium arthrosphaerae]